jgi:hypothetical protein
MKWPRDSPLPDLLIGEGSARCRETKGDLCHADSESSQGEQHQDRRTDGHWPFLEWEILLADPPGPKRVQDPISVLLSSAGGFGICA